MKTLYLNQTPRANCEGVSRRDALKVGALSFFGLTLPQFLALRSADAAVRPKAESVILLWLGGGPSHLDSFDPKPDAPAEYRGEFQAIATNVDGIQLSEHLPKTAQITNRLAIIRSLNSNIAAHEQATQYMLTGYRPLATLDYPSYGAVVAKELGVRNSIPPYCAIPNVGRAGQSGFIGAGFNAFTVADPNNARFAVSDVNLPGSVTDDRLSRRRAFTSRMNHRFVDAVPDGSVKAVDTFYERAYDLITSSAAKKAFDINAEPAELRDRYGRTTLGQGALMARRLVEAGARFVTVNMGGWDTHDRNFQRLSQQLLPPVDNALSGLVTDLADRGMLDKTLVVLMGEFGRTPRVNPRGGRDHWSRCRFAVFAGGGTRGGQVIGKSDPQGGVPAENPVAPEDVAASIYTALGIDHTKQYMTPTSRPIQLAQGKPIEQLWR